MLMLFSWVCICFAYTAVIIIFDMLTLVLFIHSSVVVHRRYFVFTEKDQFGRSIEVHCVITPHHERKWVCFVHSSNVSATPQSPTHNKTNESCAIHARSIHVRWPWKAEWVILNTTYCQATHTTVHPMPLHSAYSSQTPSEYNEMCLPPSHH